MTHIHRLHLDIETYSSTSLKDAGTYRYTESPDFEILLFGYAIDAGPVNVIDLAAGEKIPADLLHALLDPAVQKWAHNANFERICLSAWLRRHHPSLLPPLADTCEPTAPAYLSPASWYCTMTWCAYLSLPLSLEAAGDVLRLPHKKLTEGHDLIRYFCQPAKPTKADPTCTRHLPADNPEKWAAFKTYNLRDVEVELEIQEKLQKHPIPDHVWDEYHLDQEINDRGILLDLSLVQSALTIDARIRADLTARLRAFTGLRNPNSVQQLRTYLQQHGIHTDSLDKNTVNDLQKTAPRPIQEILQLRQQLSKSSVTKYQAMQATACPDHRARGMFQFYGAPRTGRWAGRYIQLQNLPQNHLPDLDEARALVRAGDYDALDLLYENIPDTLSQLIRTAFIPAPGHKFIVADYSAIEARVLAHIAREPWRIAAFKNDEDIYCASASAMFHVPVEKHGQNAHLRQKGKIAELALGYGGSTGALIAMGALDIGLEESELQPLVATWRAANPHIVQFWWDIDRAVKDAVTLQITTRSHGLLIYSTSGLLAIDLPSGRTLHYIRPRIQPNKYGGESITYEGLTTAKKWDRIETYGPKIVENIIQAISRDILANAMTLLKKHRIVGHIHDELIVECPLDTPLTAITGPMSQATTWLPGIILKADAYETMYYKKE